jgi:glycosyltransferase involved in cell wall biosynthesis
LIDACSEIKRELDDANVSVDIYGPDREHKIKELEECIASKELSGVIRFHDGIYGAEKERIIRESDVFIMTSRFEGHPTGLLEAIAYGMPCVVTTGSNMRKEIEAVDAGWTANNDAESIKEALLAMIADKNRFEEKGRNARNLAKEYDWNTIAERTHDVYKSLLKGKNQ